MRLDKYITWNWFAVFSPWLAYEFLYIMLSLPKAVEKIPEPDFEILIIPGQNDEESGESETVLVKKMILQNEHFEKKLNKTTEIKSVIGYSLRGLLAVFIALKVNGQTNWNWGLVLLPVWVYLFVQYVFAYSFRVWGNSILASLNLSDIQEGQEIDPEVAIKISHAKQLISASFLSVILTLVPAFIFILLVSRLQAKNFTTFMIILPVFIILFCCFCCVFVGITCLASVDTDEMTKEIDRNETQAQENPLTVNETEGYRPPEPVSEKATKDKESNTMPPEGSTPIYGTFNNINNEINEEHKSSTLPTTTIDADID